MRGSVCRSQACSVITDTSLSVPCLIRANPQRSRGTGDVASLRHPNFSCHANAAPETGARAQPLDLQSVICRVPRRYAPTRHRPALTRGRTEGPPDLHLRGGWGRAGLPRRGPRTASTRLRPRRRSKSPLATHFAKKAMADTSPPPESPAILLPLVLKLLAVIRSDHPPQCIGWTDDGTAVQVLDIPEFVRRYLASAAWPPYRTWEQWVQVLRQHGFGVQIGRDGTAARLEHAVWSRQQLELLAQHSQWQRHRLRQSAASPLRMNLPSSALSVPVATTAAAAAVAATRTCAVDDSGPATDSDVEDLLDDATDFEDEVDAGEPAEADRGAASGNGSRSRGYSPPAIGLSASAADVSRTAGASVDDSAANAVRGRSLAGAAAATPAEIAGRIPRQCPRRRQQLAHRADRHPKVGDAVSRGQRRQKAVAFQPAAHHLRQQPADAHCSARRRHGELGTGAGARRFGGAAPGQHALPPPHRPGGVAGAAAVRACRRTGAAPDHHGGAAGGAGAPRGLRRRWLDAACPQRWE
eukprot:ctg_616.g274